MITFITTLYLLIILIAIGVAIYERSVNHNKDTSDVFWVIVMIMIAPFVLGVIGYIIFY